MKRLILVCVLLLASCTEPGAKNSAISEFAHCSTLKVRGMSADGLFLPCLESEGKIALGSIEGPAVISAWASWCTNCESQRPFLIRLYENAKEKIQVVGVDVEEKSKEEGFKHALNNGMSYPQLYDPDGRTSKVFGPGVPITQFINSNGVLAFVQVGPLKSYKELQGLVKKYLDIEVK